MEMFNFNWYSINKYLKLKHLFKILFLNLNKKFNLNFYFEINEFLENFRKFNLNGQIENWVLEYSILC